MTNSAKRTALTVRGKVADPELWHQHGQEISIGCSMCPELALCGGLSIRAPIYNCLDLCCGTPELCNRYACPNQRRYSTLVNEANGLELTPYRRRVSPMITSQDYVPCILDVGNLVGPLSIPTVAISLYSIIDYRTGLSRYSSREQLLKKFKINPTAHVIIAATGEDRLVERFWEVLRPKKTAESLHRLRPTLIATPNFSMHANTVRHDNLVSMARIAACFNEFASVGLPVALHINGRTPHDFRRWVDYLRSSSGIYAVSYEMGTVGKSATRRAWHAEQLIALAQAVDRPLTLLLRGGSAHLRNFATAFDRVITLDTSALMKSKMRKSATRAGGQLTWRSAPTSPGEAIDELFLHNVRILRRETNAAVSVVGNHASAFTDNHWIAHTHPSTN